MSRGFRLGIVNTRSERTCHEPRDDTNIIRISRFMELGSRHYIFCLYTCILEQTTKFEDGTIIYINDL